MATEQIRFYNVEMMKNSFLLAGLFALVSLVSSSQEAQASSRAVKRLGLSVGILTEPVPSLIGYNLSYNLSNRLRLTVGYGSVSANDPNFTVDVQTYGIDGKFFVTNSNVAPFVGFGASRVIGSVTGSGTVGGLSLSAGGTFYGPSVGFDWQSNLGFNFGIEYKYLMGQGIQSTGLPGVYFGWYF
jgi:hypothetical protein